MDQFNLQILIGIFVPFFIIVIVIQSLPWMIRWIRDYNKKSDYEKLGESSKIRLIHQLNDSVLELSKNKVGAIITIVNKDSLDSYRTDGVKLDANISSSLILTIFNKNSPLHDGAIIIQDNKIKYAATYYRITTHSVSNKFGARHRAALGISETTDSLTIVVSETTGAIILALKGKFATIKPSEFQEKLTGYLN